MSLQKERCVWGSRHAYIQYFYIDHILKITGSKSLSLNIVPQVSWEWQQKRRMQFLLIPAGRVDKIRWGHVASCVWMSEHLRCWMTLVGRTLFQMSPKRGSGGKNSPLCLSQTSDSWRKNRNWTQSAKFKHSKRMMVEIQCRRSFWSLLLEYWLHDWLTAAFTAGIFSSTCGQRSHFEHFYTSKASFSLIYCKVSQRYLQTTIFD